MSAHLDVLALGALIGFALIGFAWVIGLFDDVPALNDHLWAKHREVKLPVERLFVFAEAGRYPHTGPDLAPFIAATDWRHAPRSEPMPTDEDDPPKPDQVPQDFDDATGQQRQWPEGRQLSPDRVDDMRPGPYPAKRSGPDPREIPPRHVPTKAEAQANPRDPWAGAPGCPPPTGGIGSAGPMRQDDFEAAGPAPTEPLARHLSDTPESMAERREQLAARLEPGVGFVGTYELRSIAISLKRIADYLAPR